MSISRQNLSIVIVTLKSEKVIHDCIKSINKDVPIIVVENSNNLEFKNNLQSKYNNVRCMLSKANLGYAAGNNIGIKLALTDYVYIMNPDTTLKSNTLEEIFSASEKLDDFSILSPICSDTNFPNYGFFNKKKISNDKNLPFRVDYVDGFSMLINKKKFKSNDYFDENFFMYLENVDLCRRVFNEKGSIFIIPKAQINHKGAKAVDLDFYDEVEFSRNWHWVWSKFYFNKKNFGILQAIRLTIMTYISSVLKFLFFSAIGRNIKKKIYFNRASGFYNALLGKASWYRPNIKD